MALDSNLPPLKFIALAELLPDHARVVCDSLYLAIDIFLKVYQNQSRPVGQAKETVASGRIIINKISATN